VASQATAAQPGSAGQLAAEQQRWPRQRAEAQLLPSVQALPPAPPPVVVPAVVVPPVVEAPVVVPPVVVALVLVPVVVPPVVAPPVVVVPPSPLSDELQAAANNAMKPNVIK
jgi:hypothetical protein